MRGFALKDLSRMLAFDILAPVGAVAGLVLIGATLNWPWWWVSACSVLVLIIVEATAVNFWLLRRHSVTVGTDDDRPVFRLAAVAVCTAALVTAAAFGYRYWKTPDDDLSEGAKQVVPVATAMAEAAATVTPGNPNESIDRAAAMMVPDKVDTFRQSIGRTALDLAYRNVTAQPEALAAGVEAIGPAAARVAVVLRNVQTVPDQPPKQIIAPVRITLVKRDGNWLVAEITPIHVR